MQTFIYILLSNPVRPKIIKLAEAVEVESTKPFVEAPRFRNEWACQCPILPDIKLEGIAEIESACQRWQRRA